MKTVSNKLGLLLRLSAAAGLLAFGTQAIAAGTDAGTEIDNTATISYSVNTQAQTPIDATAPTFVVDRVVNFTLDVVDELNLTQVDVAGTGAVTVFRIANLGNSPMDFALTAANLASTTDFGPAPFTDNADMVAASIQTFVANGNDDGTVDPVPGTDLGFVDAIPVDGIRLIWVVADAPAVGSDGQIAGIELTAEAAFPGAGINPAADGALGAVLSSLANVQNDATIEYVFDEDGPGIGGDGIEIVQDGYVFSSADLAVAKSSTIISDPVNGTTSPFAIPGAIIEYAVTITNNGTVTATGLSIADDIQTDLNFQTGIADFTGEDVQIEFTDASLASTTTTLCTLGDPECSLSAGTGPGGEDQLTVTVPDLEQDDSVIVRFRVEIDNT